MGLNLYILMLSSAYREDLYTVYTYILNIIRITKIFMNFFFLNRAYNFIINYKKLYDIYDIIHHSHVHTVKKHWVFRRLRDGRW